MDIKKLIILTYAINLLRKIAEWARRAATLRWCATIVPCCVANTRNARAVIWTIIALLLTGLAFSVVRIGIEITNRWTRTAWQYSRRIGLNWAYTWRTLRIVSARCTFRQTSCINISWIQYKKLTYAINWYWNIRVKFRRTSTVG